MMSGAKGRSLFCKAFGLVSKVPYDCEVSPEESYVTVWSKDKFTR